MASLFGIHIDIGENIAGYKDRPIMIIGIHIDIGENIAGYRDRPIMIIGIHIDIGENIAGYKDRPIMIIGIHIDIGENIAGYKDRPIMIIAHPLSPPPPTPNSPTYTYLFTLWPIYQKLVFKLFPPCCTYVSTVMRSAFADISVPLLPVEGPNIMT